MKTLFTIAFAMFSITIATSQVQSFTLTGCETADGDYVRGVDRNGCACYENQTTDGIITGTLGSENPGTWSYVITTDGTCSGTSTGPGGQLFGNREVGECDIREIEGDGCDPANLTNIVDLSEPEEVPTLSGRSVIFLILLIFMVSLFVVKRRF